jgi:hypothetical protein
MLDIQPGRKPPLVRRFRGWPEYLFSQVAVRQCCRVTVSTLLRLTAQHVQVRLLECVAGSSPALGAGLDGCVVPAR